MPLEIGKVVDGTVTGITNFGAFIQLPDGSTGLCHISEIADEYVKNVKDYLKEQQVVKVKVIEMNGSGKVSLSIRKASEKKESKPETISAPSKPERKQFDRRPNDRRPNDKRPNDRRQNDRRQNDRRSNDRRPNDRRQKFNKPNNMQGSFEDMLSKFIKDSDEKLKTIKKSASNRRGNGFNRNG